MTQLYAQGDILLELIEEATPADPSEAGEGGTIVLARGEATGHRHVLSGGRAAFYRDDAAARDIPSDLYIGHVRIDGASAELRHEEHATVTVPRGTYRVRRQREWEGGAVRPVAD